ncbi:Rpn family recombination-promoting nuclease/putative transposase [Dethiothermospora halolimnae]|uniref:Rpn family recombination-promoting nuclease/putative transposase n=1 Tax=Dethiothermospora halolimnae TaxID=3114390 RepID=UPI003CCC0644
MRKTYRLPAIVPIVLYNGRSNWTAARNFKEILKGYELFDENIIDFRYLLLDVNRMEKEELLEIANIVSSVFLLDQDIEVKEIVKRLKLIGRLVRKGPTKEQRKTFNSWLKNVLKNRFTKEVSENVFKVLIETSGEEDDDMVSNLGRNIERALKEERQDGIEKGMEKGIEKVAVEMILDGESNEKIKKYTKLDDIQIEKLRNKITKN